MPEDPSSQSDSTSETEGAPIHNGKVEINAEFVEAFLRQQNKDLNPIARLLGGYYVELNKSGCDKHLAMTLTVEMQKYLLNAWGSSLQLSKQLVEIKQAAAELNKAVADYRKMKEEMES